MNFILKQRIMKQLFKDATTLGVIISRMQVPFLTQSHINMIETVQERHNKLLILLGVSDEINLKNPFTFDFRRQMISKYLRESDIIVPLRDMPKNNAKWVELVDLHVYANLVGLEGAVLYGGRDSFIPYYENEKGLFQTQELLPEDNDSGTELRNVATTKIPRYSKETAEAVIYYINKIQERK
jgi:bifunctional NMN adenylyltransferase/nudix hydrolase